MGILQRSIHDGRFLALVEGLLKAGYLEDWRFNRTHSGTPQGGVVSPLLANIYLNELDRFVTTELIPTYMKGDKRKPNPEYERLRSRAKKAKAKGDMEKYRAYALQARRLPSSDAYDPSSPRLRYVRFADDCAPQRREGSGTGPDPERHAA